MVTLRFGGKVVLLTGASGGIGQALARGFAREGATLALVGRDEERTKNIANETSAAYQCTLDITNSENCKKIVEDIFNKTGSLDVVVNNAGAMFRGDVVDTPDDQWLRLFDINVHAVFYLSREAVRIMRRHNIKGNIVQVASNSALSGRKGHVAYATTKGAVVQITRCLALDCATDGIRINAICPGTTNTSMPMSKHTTPMSEELLLEACRQNIPMQRMAEPSEVVAPILFLASDESSYMTGTTLSVDGGTTA